MLLVFVESYGAVTYQTPAIADGLVESRADLRAAVARNRSRSSHGLRRVADLRRIVVARPLEPHLRRRSQRPVRLHVDDGVEPRDDDHQLRAAGISNSRADAGHASGVARGRLLSLRPDLRAGPARVRGPEFGWWSIPDQYALAKIDALERNRLTRKPLFLVFPTSTTHAPFGPVAPYQPDWSKMLSSDAFVKADVDRAMAATPDLTNLRPSYTHAMAYEYRTIAGYLRRHPRDGMVLIASAITSRQRP